MASTTEETIDIHNVRNVAIVGAGVRCFAVHKADVSFVFCVVQVVQFFELYIFTLALSSDNPGPQPLGLTPWLDCKILLLLLLFCCCCCCCLGCVFVWSDSKFLSCSELFGV